MPMAMRNSKKKKKTKFIMRRSRRSPKKGKRNKQIESVDFYNNIATILNYKGDRGLALTPFQELLLCIPM